MRNRLDKSRWRNLAANLMRQIMYDRFTVAHEPLLRSLLIKAGFQNYFSLGNSEQDEEPQRVAIVDKSSNLRGFQGALVNDQFHLTYSDDISSHAEKIKG